MAGGIAHGKDRQYQVRCRNVLMYRNPQFKPLAKDGVDVPLTLPDTRWTFDVALQDNDGSIVLVECRRTVGAVKQEAVASFAYKIELARKSLSIPVAGIFITKGKHQIGAVKVGQFNSIQVVILAEESEPPGFNIAFLRYSEELEKLCRDLVMHIPSGSLTFSSDPPTVEHNNANVAEPNGV